MIVLTLLIMSAAMMETDKITTCIYLHGLVETFGKEHGNTPDALNWNTTETAPGLNQL